MGFSTILRCREHFRLTGPEKSALLLVLLLAFLGVTVRWLRSAEVGGEKPELTVQP